jgi:hypothetical protein
VAAKKINHRSRDKEASMKRFLGSMMLSLFFASAALAAGPKDYQVTGPVLDVTDDVVTVQKGSDKWEIARNKDTKISGDLKKGSKVTIMYKMTASSIDVKDAGKTKADTKAKSK